MEEDSSISVDHLQFSCSICLDLLKDPVTAPCGHSFCMLCINDFWDHLSKNGHFSCPQCRETFSPRPVLRRNNVMAEVVEKLKKKELTGSASSTQFISEFRDREGDGDVECDICSENKEKAVKSCLVCLVSFCQTHIKPHYESPAFRKHRLVQTCRQLEEKICSRHDKLKEIYCRTDQQLICPLCEFSGHKGHITIPVSVERAEKQVQVKEMQRKSQQRIQEIKKKVQDVMEAVNTIKSTAEAAVEESERVFTELLLSLEQKRSKVRKQIQDQEKSELERTEGILQQLDKDISDLNRRVAELEELSHTEDHVTFLQRFQSLCNAGKIKDLSRMTINENISFDGVRKSLSDLKHQLDEFCTEEFNQISRNVAKVQMILPFEPKTREEFLQYFCQLTLDPNTANEALWLSENNRNVSRSGHLKLYPSHPDRFDAYGQVLCKESVCGRCYWEVELSKGGWVYVSVSYKSINRKGQGNKCWFGHNNQSWSLEYNSTLSFWHNNVQTKIPLPSSPRIGVYVDHTAGTLSFYSISETMTLLHKVHTTFTQPLYPGFWVNVLATARLCNCGIALHDTRSACI